MLLSGFPRRVGAEDLARRNFGLLVSAARCCSTGSGRLGGAAAAGGGRDALSYGVSFATTRSHQLAEGGPEFTPLITLTRARARPWSARCYGVARQRDRSRQNSTGVSGVLLSGISGSRVVPKNLARRKRKKNKAIADQSPLLKLSLRRVRFQRTSTRQQLDCAKTL